MTEPIALQGVFITGTDTGVGKTFIGSAIVAELYKRGTSVQPRKPVETGCEPDNPTHTSDTQAYYTAVNGSLPLSTITPLQFHAALAPPYAAELQGQTLKLDQLLENIKQSVTKEHIIIAEGAGGVYSPIAHDGLNIDLIKQTQLPALLVCANRLGCVNHALLSLYALAQHNIDVLAVILNEVSPISETLHQANVTALENYIDVPLYQVGYDRVGDDVIGQLVKIIMNNSDSDNS